MSYPKPLSEKSIAIMYKKINLSSKKIEFLHDFYEACSNLYACIPLCDAWEVYKELANKAQICKSTKAHKKDAKT